MPVKRHGKTFPLITLALIFATTPALAKPAFKLPGRGSAILNSWHLQLKGYGSYSTLEYANTKRGVTVNDSKSTLNYAASIDLAVSITRRVYLESGFGAANRNFDVRTTISNQVITSRNKARLYYVPLQLRLLAGNIFAGGGVYYGRYASGASLGMKTKSFGYMGSFGLFLTDDTSSQKVVGSVDGTIGEFFKDPLNFRWFAEIRIMKDHSNQSADPSESLKFSQIYAGLGIVF